MGADGSRHYDAVREVVTSANRGNVVIHTLDPRDLSTRGFPGDANSTLALDTGGRALGRSNDFTRGLRAVIADASAYYLLGYVPTRPANDGKFHKIDVKVRRTGARVLARRGTGRRRWRRPLPAADTVGARRRDGSAGSARNAAGPAGRVVARRRAVARRPGHADPELGARLAAGIRRRGGASPDAARR